mmetsp:Transcript_42166/g.67444  ORF Transcript_42166/g.67444 Transcript_42166/m.67444 type:complete len:80 (+) Transcript_42166:1929-2168(+)
MINSFISAFFLNGWYERMNTCMGTKMCEPKADSMHRFFHVDFRDPLVRFKLFTVNEKNSVLNLNVSNIAETLIHSEIPK